MGIGKHQMVVLCVCVICAFVICDIVKSIRQTHRNKHISDRFNQIHRTLMTDGDRTSQKEREGADNIGIFLFLSEINQNHTRIHEPMVNYAMTYAKMPNS